MAELSSEILPLATYVEKRFEGERTVDLFENRVEVRGKEYLGAEYKISVPLESLSPHFVRLRFRNKTYLHSLCGFAISLVAVMLLTSYWKMSLWSELPMLGLVIGGSLLALGIATRKRIDWIQFRTVAGVDIIAFAKAGKDADSFEAFAQRIVEQMARVKDAEKGKESKTAALETSRDQEGH